MPSLCPYLLLLWLLAYIQGTFGSNKLLVLFVDGLRWDYIADNPRLFPGFHALYKTGVRAHHLEPVFPTICYPNLYSFATGLYPESHGWIGNYMYDEKKNKVILRGKDRLDRHWWEDAEPFWVTAKKQGKKVNLYYWPGCEIEIKGVKPDHCQPYSFFPSKENVVTSIQAGLTAMSEYKADVVGITIEHLDFYGHIAGINSLEMKYRLKEMDDIIKFLLQDLEERNLDNKVNIIIMSDHGMTEISMDKEINLQNVLDRENVKLTLDGGAYVNVWPREDNLDLVYERLKKQPNLNVYKIHEIPDRWHYSGHTRVAPITAVADPGWVIVTHQKPFPIILDTQKQKKHYSRAGHGYDNNHPDMWGSFIAAGPDFKEGLASRDSISIVDIYQLMCHTLDIKPEANNGTWENVVPFLRVKRDNNSERSIKYDISGQNSVMQFKSSMLLSLWAILLFFLV